MSFVLPATYKLVADNLGQAYAAIRDAIYDTNGDTVYNEMNASLKLLVEDPDDQVYIAQATDPAGSIARDISSAWFTAGNTSFTAAQAKSYAASLLSGAFKSLNNHSVNRTGVSNIGTYYSTYAYSASRANTFNLFVEGDTGSYFTQEFAELSAQLNVTINSQYIQP